MPLNRNTIHVAWRGAQDINDGHGNRGEMPMLFVTVPTRGDHPDLLNRLATASGLDPARIIIVRTDPAAWTPPGVVVVDDFDPINIHRWWNRGIQEAMSRGADTVAVLNDDIVVSSVGLNALEERIIETGATLATPGPESDLITSRWPRSRVLFGSLWLVNVRHGLRPDERYRWFYGDDDLDIRARTRFHGIATAPIDFSHVHAGESTASSPTLLDLADRDAETFRRSHRWHYVQRKAIDRSQGRTGRAVRRLVRRLPRS